MCVCVCVCEKGEREKERERDCALAPTAETLLNHAASSAIAKAHDKQQFEELHTLRRLMEHVCEVHAIRFDSVRTRAIHCRQSGVRVCVYAG